MGKEIERARAFARDLEDAYGSALVAAVLYGSAARGEYREGVSDLNVLVLLSDTGPETLRKGSALARAWVKEGNRPPLLMGEAEWRASTDVFAIEMADIRDAHLVLHGADPFAGIAIDPADLRRQCESELKGKYIQLRERYLLAAGEPEELRALLLRSFSTFLVLFRTVLRLAGGDPARDPEAVIRETAGRVGFDAEPLLEIHRARGGGAQLDLRADSPLVVGYLEAVDRVVHYVDRFSDGSS